MESTSHRAIAIVGAGAILPDAPNVPAFWENIKSGRYSVTEVDPARWDPALYYDPDPKAPDKTYSKIGGWVRDYAWDPIKWRLAIPPRVVDGMDGGQKWAVACTREALEDYGYPQRPLDLDRTAVILGNAMAGEKHYFTALRVYFPECARDLESSEHFAALPDHVRHEILRELHDRMAKHLPEVTEDTMPGELSNCIAGRIANIFNFHGPNYVCDAACASAMAAISSAIEGLVEHHFDAMITGGIDRNMGAPSFVKFCKIGALSATGTRPYAQGADGFVMGEGAALFLMKRLTDAERDGDKIYAVIRGIGGSSDGKGKGITAPNPVGQRFAIERAWETAGLSPGTVTYIEGHGTSTRVGDVVEVQSMADVLKDSHLPPHSVAIGSVKSNFGHLKSAAGAAGLLKAALALHEKVLPPSVHCEHPNPDIDFAHSPLYVNTELKPWTVPPDGVRRAGLSAFGFGGTNFHAVLEEYISHRLNGNGKKSIAVPDIPTEIMESSMSAKVPVCSPPTCKAPLRGALVIGAASESVLIERLRLVEKEAAAGRAPMPTAPAESDLRAPERFAIDYANADELKEKAGNALKALTAKQPAIWKALRAQGIYRGHGPAPKVAFLYPGQGSQYLNMLQPLCAVEPIVAETFAEADRVMTPLLGKPLSEFVFVDTTNAEALARAEDDLRQTAITQPAVLATDLALTRLLAAYGIRPDFAMGHSLGEYGALVAVDALPFADALEAVSARGRGMTQVAMKDNGRMAAVFAPLEEIERILKTVDGYVVIANINSDRQAVIGGASHAVEQAMQAFQQAGFEVSALAVSHAFHTSIVAPASEPLRRALERLRLAPPKLPIVANTNGEFYPTGSCVVPKMLGILAQQVAAPVQFVKGLRTLYDAGARVFVEVGPKKALHGFAEDVLGPRGDVISLFTNHPKNGDLPAFNQALCCLYAAGLGRGTAQITHATVETLVKEIPNQMREVILSPKPAPERASAPTNGNRYLELGRMFAEVLDRGWEIYQGKKPTQPAEPVTITGAALGLPGTEHVFDDANVARLLRGDQFIDTIPIRFRQSMLDKHITRLVKNENGGGAFETITDVAEVIKLAGRAGAFDLEREFGVSTERNAALDRDTQLAIAVGIDALCDAGIPLVMRYKTTSKGTRLPDRWMLPEALRDETGVIFASAFPGLNSFADEMSRYSADLARREQLSALQSLRARASDATSDTNGESILAQEIDHRIEDLCDLIQKERYVFDRRFLFRVLPMGHSQFAEFIGARGPNTAINAACASTTQAIALAEDWICTGRCRRVIVVAADDVTSDNLLPWIGGGFLASGAAATDDDVEKAAVPFDRRRHGMIVGMGAAGLVVESAQCVRERGLQPICDVLSAVTANSAFHGTRLDVSHIGQVMEDLVRKAEISCGIDRHQIAPRTVFVSHETYTPARGGSAAAEIHALRKVFGKSADHIVIANTKGFTGHAMGAGVEDVLAVKALETGVVPPVANFKEVDPELGTLNLSKGGVYPIEYALRLGAGFGSQISMTLFRWTATKDGAHRAANNLGYSYRIVDRTTWNAWLSEIGGQPNSDLEVVHRTLRIRDDVSVGKRVEAANPATEPVSEPKTEGVQALPRQAIQTATPIVELAKPLPAQSAIAQPTAGLPAPDALPVESKATPQLLKLEKSALVDPASSTGPVKSRILALVVEKTGYPQDMLDLDLDLEADLGVDTVKQAEMFAAIREIYNIPRDENRKLRDYPTLAHVIRFVYEKRPDLAVASAPISETKVEIVPSPPVSPALSVPSVVSAFEPPPVRSPSGSVTNHSDEIKEKVLDIVAEKTGYPKDMLDLELDLEADLGIDTVKQAEMFAAIRATYNIPRDENLKLRDFPTLKHVIQFAQDRAALVALASKSERPIEDAKTATASGAAPALLSFEAANKIPRRVPLLVLRPPLELCKPTGVTLEHKRIIVMPDESGVADALVQSLKTKGVETLRINSTPDAQTLTDLLKNWTAAGAIDGIYWLPALDCEGNLRDMDSANWHEAVRVRVKSLYTAMRALYEQIAKPGTFLIAATRLGGQHGYDEAGAFAPLGGAVAGFAKTYKRERPDATVKAVDFEATAEPCDIVERLIQEALLDPGAIEIGYKNNLRWTIGLEEQPAADGQPGLTLDRNSVFLITGAAGSIVSAITADLAAASGGTFYLLDLVPEPVPNNTDIQRFVTDKEGLKRDLFARIQARGGRATPALVEKELAALERAHAALDAIQRVRAAGGTAHYFSVDLTDAEAVAKIIAQVRERSGRIDVLLHAAGLDRSRSLAEKEPREFDLVFDVKADGFFNLLHAIGDMPLTSVIAFSSIAGRFGNPGQTDYSSANDLLCKITSSMKTTRPGTRAIAIDWTAWGGIGMATRGSIPKIMATAGIDMLPPEAGIPMIRRELTAGGTRGEVVIGQSLGVLLKEWDETGGLDSTATKCPRGPMLGNIVSTGVSTPLKVETTLDPKVQPFLYDHQIDGTPVLPGVMGIEAFAEAATALLPGWHVESIDDVNFLAPFKFYRNEPRTVTVEATVHPLGEQVIAHCRLIGQRTLPNQSEPQVTTHFTARVLLDNRPSKIAAGPVIKLEGNVVDSADIYTLYFHGPAYQVIEKAWWNGKRIIGQFSGKLPNNHHPAALATTLAPRLVELCFQTAGIWEMGHNGRMGLPLHIDRLTISTGLSESVKGPIYAVVTRRDPASFNAEIVDAKGNRYLQLSGYRTVALPGTIDAAKLKPLQAAMSLDLVAA